MQNARYEVDPYNRLVIDGSGDEGGLQKFRQVLDGRFAIDGKNNLSYHIKAPLDETENIPHQVRLDGAWSLTDNHELRLTIDKLGRDTFGDEITLRGQILDVDKNSILFSVTTQTKDNTQSTYILNLQGSWKADANNRLSFRVEREKSAYDILTFTGAWEINNDHQIVYQYEKGSLVREKKEVHTLLFKGHWDIRDKVRISYILDASSDSSFDFQSSAGIFKEDFIRYEVGIGLERRPRPLIRKVFLYGEWRLKRDIGIVFEVEYGEGEVYAITLGADVLDGRVCQDQFFSTVKMNSFCH